METSSNNAPFKLLGEEPKALRQKLSESLIEVSGAIEIDVDRLERIEKGFEQPSEDILMLLISHFSMSDDQAVELWKLAGYDRSNAKTETIEDEFKQHSVVIMMALDTRVVYSDGIDIKSNKNGMVLNFTQTGIETSGHALPIARIGMSYEQAYDVMRLLHQKLTDGSRQLNTKSLAAPKNSIEKPRAKRPRNKKS